MAFRANVTDKQQDEIENAEHEAGVPVYADGKTRIIGRGQHTATQRTQNAGIDLRSNAGVIIPHDDLPNNFAGDTIGRKV